MSEFESGYTTIRRFRHGNARKLMCLTNDDYIGRTVELFGEYSESEVDVFRRFVKPDSMVIDAGALFGEHTLALAELCPQGTVFAFEPQRIPFQMCAGNLQLNSMMNVEVNKSALGEGEGIAQIVPYDPRHPNPWGMQSLCGAPESMTLARGYEPVRVRSIDGLNVRRLDFLKVDVEGFEPHVLRGAHETILRCRPVIYCEFNFNRSELLSMLEAWGYRCWRHLAPVDREPNFLGNPLSLRGEQVLPESDMLLACCLGSVPESAWLSDNGFRSARHSWHDQFRVNDGTRTGLDLV